MNLKILPLCDTESDRGRYRYTIPGLVRRPHAQGTANPRGVVPAPIVVKPALDAASGASGRNALPEPKGAKGAFRPSVGGRRRDWRLAGPSVTLSLAMTNSAVDRQIQQAIGYYHKLNLATLPQLLLPNSILQGHVSTVAELLAILDQHLPTTVRVGRTALA